MNRRGVPSYRTLENTDNAQSLILSLIKYSLSDSWKLRNLSAISIKSSRCRQATMTIQTNPVAKSIDLMHFTRETSYWAHVFDIFVYPLAHS